MNSEGMGSPQANNVIKAGDSGLKRKHEEGTEDGDKAAAENALNSGDEADGKQRLPKELTAKFGPLECKLCKVKVDSAVTAYEHYNGKAHTKRINAYLVEHNMPIIATKKTKTSEATVCQVCNVPLNSESHAKQHYIGKTHLKNLRNPKSNHAPLAPAVRDPTGRFGIGADFLSIKPLPPPPPLPAKPKPGSSESPKFFCNVCCVYTTSREQLEAHNKGVKHAKRLKKGTICEQETSRNLSMYRTPSDQYYCPLCNLTSNSSEQFVQHTESKRHKKNIKQK